MTPGSPEAVRLADSAQLGVIPVVGIQRDVAASVVERCGSHAVGEATTDEDAARAEDEEIYHSCQLKDKHLPWWAKSDRGY